jgi:hypothetical protein
MMKYGSIFMRMRSHTMNYMIRGIQVLVVNRVPGPLKKVRILGLADGGGKMTSIRNADCTGKKVNSYFCLPI